jgi:hypothetical protein
MRYSFVILLKCSFSWRAASGHVTIGSHVTPLREIPLLFGDGSVRATIVRMLVSLMFFSSEEISCVDDDYPLNQGSLANMKITRVHKGERRRLLFRHPLLRNIIPQIRIKSTNLRYDPVSCFSASRLNASECKKCYS